MKSLTIAVLSDDPARRAEVCRLLAKGEKGGAEEDVVFYHAKSPDLLLTVIDPIKYPEKVQSLLYALAISDYCILVFDKLTAAVGETILALDAAGKKGGCILTSLHPSQLEPFLKGTLPGSYQVFSEAEKVKEAAFGFIPPSRDGLAKGVIDHSFEVKGVGSVALGFVQRGTINVHDKLTVFPSGKQMEIRSIQMQDDDYDSASAGDRFGVCFKGLAAADVSKGDVIGPAGGSVKAASELAISPRLNRFSKELRDGEALHASIGLQFVPCRFAGSKLVFDSPVAYDGAEPIVLVRLNEKALRVAGSA